MKMSHIRLLLLTITALPGCTKKDPETISCEGILNAAVYANSPITIGQKLIFGTQEIDGYRVYNWTGPNNYQTNVVKDSVVYVELKNEGWYYMTVFNPNGTCIKSDSVYVDVLLQQGTAPCTINNNNTNYNNQ